MVDNKVIIFRSKIELPINGEKVLTQLFNVKKVYNYISNFDNSLLLNKYLVFRKQLLKLSDEMSVDYLVYDYKILKNLKDYVVVTISKKISNDLYLIYMQSLEDFPINEKYDRGNVTVTHSNLIINNLIEFRLLHQQYFKCMQSQFLG